MVRNPSKHPAYHAGRTRIPEVNALARRFRDELHAMRVTMVERGIARGELPKGCANSIFAGAHGVRTRVGDAPSAGGNWASTI